MMHQSILAKRKAIAQDRILTSALALVAQLQLDPALAEGLEPKGVRDSATVEMMRLEGLADLMEQLAAQPTSPPSPVTTVTDEVPQEPESKPLDESMPGPVLDELPPPVLDDEPTEAEPKKPARSKRKK
jgi:hypothetical protein